ncbi:zinc finger BED domain-containing protein 5-like [Xyrauchen texanus]|uniref:zinc finger BED domain-containing protein 5-like n=1 Tax=Xyrauchen texanus TaxID=154827 RepID=UPI0022429CF1|nr:zinc finger BED domain-containing protein 5-like [Xyrauchen texanus]
MDTFVIRKVKNVEEIVDSLPESSEPCTSTKHKSKTPSDQCRKRRKYQEEFIKYGFTCSTVNDVDHPQCVICSEVLAHESMKPEKMQRHLETRHPACVEKPIDFFRRKEKELQIQKRTLAQQTQITANALKASYEVAYLIAQSKKPHSIGETLIKPAAVAMCRAMHGEKISSELMTVPLSNDMIARHIHDISKDIKSQLINRINGKKYALQLDESTDVSNSAQLLAFIRYTFDGKLHEEMLFCSELEGTCTGSDIFNKLDTRLKEMRLSWDNCVGICTDGAGAMVGKNKGLKAKVLEVAPHVKFTHCIIHRESLASKALDSELNSVLKSAIKIVNHIKSRPVTSRLLATLCNEMGSQHEALLFHTEVRWLSCGKALGRLYELREEVHSLLKESKSEFAHHLTDPDWLSKLAYLACIFERLNMLNLSLQGPNTNILTMNEKIDAFVKKLERWAERVEQGNVEMFPELDEHLEENGLSLGSLKTHITGHLHCLLEQFQKYFPKEMQPELYEWIRQPFTETRTNLPTKLEDALLELSSDRTLKTLFSSSTLPEFWIAVAEEYRELSGVAVDVLLPFGSTYLCEQTFSAVTYMKNKYRSRLDVEDDLRVAVSNIRPQIKLLCTEKQVHPSH